MDKLTLNNQIVNMRKLVAKARALTIRQRIRKLKRAQSHELENKKSVCERILEEIKHLKKINIDDISKYALCNDVSIGACQKLISNVLLPLDIRCIAKVLSHKVMQSCVDHFKLKYPNWKCEVPLILSVLGALRKKKKKKPSTVKSRSVLQSKVIKNDNAGQNSESSFVIGSNKLEQLDDETDHESQVDLESLDDKSEHMIETNCDFTKNDSESSCKISPNEGAVTHQFSHSEKIMSSAGDPKKTGSIDLSSTPQVSETSIQKKNTGSKNIVNSSVISMKQKPKKLKTNTKNYDLSAIIQNASQLPKQKSDVSDICDDSKDEQALQSTLFSSLVRDNLKQMKLHLIPSQLEKSEGSVEIKCLDLNHIDDDEVCLPSNQTSLENSEGRALVDPSDDFFASPDECGNVLSSKKIIGFRSDRQHDRRFLPNRRGLLTHDRHLSRSTNRRNFENFSSNSRAPLVAHEEKVVINRKIRRALAGSGYNAEAFSKQDVHTKRKLISEILPNKRNRKEPKVNVLVPETLHPSWAAKRKLKDSQFQIDTFKGKKTTFDD